MLFLFITITIFENFETFDTAVDVFDFDSVLGKTAVEGPLLRREVSSFWFLERRCAECVKVAYTLKTFVADKQNVVKYMYAALLVHFEIMHRTFCLAHAYYLAVLSVYYQ